MTKALRSTNSANAPPREMTWEEWLAWAPESRITEWVDGEVIEMSPIGARHDEISQWLTAVLGIFLETPQAGRLRRAPSILKLSSLPRGREPDLMFISSGNIERLHDTYVEGPVDAVWEIVSPESVVRDREIKYGEYESEGITEYWLIDPQEQQLELYRLDSGGRYRQVALNNGMLESTVITGFYLRPEWLWSDPLPMELDIVRELGALSQ
jgi:Uma2 family endonuclease